jgi:hypothetical protein
MNILILLLKILGVLALIFMLVGVYACFKVAGQCDEDERKDGE